MLGFQGRNSQLNYIIPGSEDIAVLPIRLYWIHCDLGGGGGGGGEAKVGRETVP